MTQPTIPPALTPEEWAAAYREVPGTTGPGYIVREGGEWKYTLRAFTLGGVWIEAPADADVDVEPAHLPALMALANAALPDGHPGKIQAATVERLQQAATYIRSATRREYGYDEDNWGNVPRHYMAVADGLESDAAKLASLLPPEAR